MGARPSTFTAEVVSVVPARQWAEQQQAIFNWFECPAEYDTGYDNLIVRARAGTGKTTTILEGVERSPEQRIVLCAFN